MRRRLTTALFVWAAWTALATFFGITTSLTYVSQGRPPVWGLALAFALAQWWIWAALTPIVVWLARRFRLARGRPGIYLPLHFALGLGVAFAKVTIEGWVRLWLFGARPYLLINNLALQVLIYGALVALVHALDHYGRSREQASATEARLREAQLDLLRAQLQPHFLFNALNAISELVHEDPDRADRMIGRLSELLRATLETGTRSLVPLEDELRLVDHYLAIQRVRFGDRLTVTIDVPADCRRVEVPHFFLQPLVENALVHGLAPRAEGGWVRLSAERRGRQLVLRIEDDGVGLGAVQDAGGIGLANSRARLSSIFGDTASLVLAGRPGGGAIVTATMPIDERETPRPRP